MKRTLLATAILFSVLLASTQPILLMDRFNGNTIVNDSTITVFSSDTSIFDLTKYFTMKNNTDRTLAVFLRKTINIMNDSTSDYFCFGVKCWPDSDTTNIPDSIQPGAEDYTFASHVTHVRRFDLPQPLLPVGLSSITYTIFDNTTFPEPVEASVTVIYQHSALGIEEQQKNTSEALVYPNPASEKLTVECPLLKPGNYNLLLFDCRGIPIKKTDIHLSNNKFTFPVGNLQPGTYFGKLVSAQGDEIPFSFQVVR